MTDPNIRGIEHVGITVPDIDAAETFLARAFGAVRVYDALREPVGGLELEVHLGLPGGAAILRARMLRLADGANVELFQYGGVPQRPVHRPSDLGLQHLAIQVSDIRAAIDRVVAAGGEQLSAPLDLPERASGAGNLFAYLRAPWGTTIELIAWASPEAYERDTEVRAWRPGRV